MRMHMYTRMYTLLLHHALPQTLEKPTYSYNIIRTLHTEHDELAKDAKKEADAASRKLARATADLDEAQRQLEALTTERDALKKKTAGAKDLEIEVEALRIVAEQGKKDAAALVQANSMVEEVDRLYREEQLLRKKVCDVAIASECGHKCADYCTHVF